MIKKIYSIYLWVVHSLKDPDRVGRKYISPLFVMMLLLSSALWYITKLGYNYTTEIGVVIHVEDAKFATSYVAEGVGFKLLGYNLYKGGDIKVPIKELKYKTTTSKDGVKSINIDETSLLNALTMRFNDIKIHSLGPIPSLEMSEKMAESIKK
ncbi:MAG: hypothetical protein SNG35_06650 [Rikenellaceae bacterium]